MLSKSQARLFFLTATAGFSGVFLFLTVDTIRQVPERSNEDAMTEQVVRGKEIWEKNNCMGCHTILGEGAYYAPELTRAYVRRGEDWLKIFLADPQAMYPGQRKMVQYDFSEQEIDDVIAFLKWIGEIDTNGFPREPDLALPVQTAAASTSSPGPAAPAIFSTVCVGCHALGGQGGVVGPALDGVGMRYSEAELRAWLADPQSIKPGTTMPNLTLSDADLDGLTAFLMAQK
ncbi:MAG: c-type cytochrome [Alphaproteobacteria bacterium]|nr:c-type cytochrome [Alphaproteobacteria bacterium]